MISEVLNSGSTIEGLKRKVLETGGNGNFSGGVASPCPFCVEVEWIIFKGYFEKKLFKWRYTLFPTHLL